ncbi:MAG: divalent-cation tolerance protein CutA [Gemmatimonadaceae bacterium]|nr:divalent-cation tolerance protein CutA [Gemmatimonadaceae bacterium]
METTPSSPAATTTADEPRALVLVLTTLPAGHDADAFLQALLEARLIACGSIQGPVRSVYRWQGTIEKSDEQQIVLKTSAARTVELEEAVRALHPYEVPEWLVLPVTAASSAYTAWVLGETASR